MTYGLGSESQNLPAFVVMYDHARPRPAQGPRRTGARASCPASIKARGSSRRASRSTISSAPSDLTDRAQRAQLDLLAQLNHAPAREHRPAKRELAARIESFELAYRMQMAAPEALDLDDEPEHIRKLYGLDNKQCTHFAKQCLMARRLVERGVRFVQIYSGGMENQLSWDGHTDIAGNHRGFAGETDQPIAALLTDLKQRGLLDSTLVIWGGEFGRLPIVAKRRQAGPRSQPARLHRLARGRRRERRRSYGETDEIGHKAAVDKVSVNDLHATILARSASITRS